MNAKRKQRHVNLSRLPLKMPFAGIVVGSLLFLVAACSAPGEEEAVPVEVGLPPTAPAQVMQADTPTPEDVDIVTATPETSPAAEATAEASDIEPIDAVTALLDVEFPFPEESTVELSEDEDLAVVHTPYTLEEATGIAEGTMIANGYELIEQVGSAENELVYTFQRADQIATITIEQSEEGEGTIMQFATVDQAE